MGRRFFNVRGAAGGRHRGLHGGTHECFLSAISTRLSRGLGGLNIRKCRVRGMMRRVSRSNGTDPITDSGSPSIVLIRCRSVLNRAVRCVPPEMGVRVDYLSVGRPARSHLVSSCVRRAFPKRSRATATAVEAILPAQAFLRGTFLLYRRFRGRSPHCIQVSERLCSLRHLVSARFNGRTLRSVSLCRHVIGRHSVCCTMKCMSCSGLVPDRVSFIPERRLVGS